MLLSFNIDVMPKVRLLGHIVYKKPWIHFERIINEYILYIIKSGEMYIQEGERKYILRKGDILLLRPNIVHVGFQESCCDYYYIHFKHPGIGVINDSDYSEKVKEILLNRKLSLTSNFLLEDLPLDPVCYFENHYHLMNQNNLIYLLNDAVDNFYNKYENYKQLASSQFLSIIIQIGREYTTTNIENIQDRFPKSFVKARTVLDFLNTEYHKKITSTEIECLCASDYDYINRVFHKMSGYTIFNYLNMVRINKAKELIETTSIKFSEIGYLVGIEDQYYFSKLFKKYSGMTPTQYLEKNNKVSTGDGK